MKLTVDIKRRSDQGLDVCVVQHGSRGRNLAGDCTKVVTAQERAQKALQKYLLAGYEIEWTGETSDSDLVHAADKKISTKRDEYGL